MNYSVSEIKKDLLNDPFYIFKQKVNDKMHIGFLSVRENCYIFFSAEYWMFKKSNENFYFNLSEAKTDIFKLL